MSKKPDQQLVSILSALPEGATLDHYVKHECTIELFVTWNEPERGKRICPRCHSNRCVKKDSGTSQTVRHLSSGSAGLLITFHKPRYVCKDCGRTFFLKPDWVDGNTSITRHLHLRIILELTGSTKCLKQIAADTCTTPAIVKSVMDNIHIEKPSRLPETLGIDEFHGQTGKYNKESGRFDTEKYHCVITDHDNSRVIDILYKATFRELHGYFMEYHPIIRQQVRFFCSDMRSGFSKVARACFPNARICIDLFHVVKLLTEAISAIRVTSWRSLNDKAAAAMASAVAFRESGDMASYERKIGESRKLKDDAILIKNSQRLIVTSPYNESAYWNRNPDRRQERLNEIFAIAPDLKTAYEALEEFYVLSSVPSFKGQREQLSEWIMKYLSCEIPEIHQAARSIKAHRKGIENSWRYNKSNGPTEGLNRKIKDCRRMAFGAHDFNNFRKRALLACGCVCKSTYVGYTIFNEKKISDNTPGITPDHHDIDKEA